jgi:protein-disulfide isomerase
MRWFLVLGLIFAACQQKADAPPAPQASAAGELSLEVNPLGGGPSAPIDISGSPVMGPEGAKLTIVEFTNFRCKPCSRMSKVIGAFAKEHPKEVRVIFKHGLLGDPGASFPVHEAAQAAQEQGKFWEFEELLFSKQMAFSTMQLQSYAAIAGLDSVRFNQDTASQRWRPIVERDFYEADLLGHRGTPVVYVNGQGYFGVSDSEMKAKLEAMLSGSCVAGQTC